MGGLRCIQRRDKFYRGASKVNIPIVLLAQSTQSNSTNIRIPYGMPVDANIIMQYPSIDHVAYDFGIPIGTQVKNILEGNVISAGWNNDGCGNEVVVTYEKYMVRDCHLSSVLVNVGQQVKYGDIIGLSGTSGNSNGPHLHTEVRYDGNIIFPNVFITKSIDNCTINKNYPGSILQWCDVIQKYANNELPVNLISAIMLQESGGNPIAYSSSGAMGLMQVMPKDGIAANFQCANGPCFADRPTMEELKNPEYNIDYGTKMLFGLLKNTGNIRDALKSYGPSDMGYGYADKVLAIYNNYK